MQPMPSPSGAGTPAVAAGSSFHDTSGSSGSSLTSIFSAGHRRPEHGTEGAQGLDESSQVRRSLDRPTNRRERRLPPVPEHGGVDADVP